MPTHLHHTLARATRAAQLAQGLGALFWLPQAGLIAWAVQHWAEHGRIAFYVGLQAATGVLVLGLCKASLEAWATRRIYIAARQSLSEVRASVSQILATRSPLDKQRPACGLAASAIAEQAEAVIPWLVRYQPAQWRVMVVPPLIVLSIAPISWLAALVLVVSAPLIPMFMAIVGWRAQTACEEQMIELGQMNVFLLDRLRGMTTLRALGAVQASAIRLQQMGQSLRQRSMVVLKIAFLSSAVLELFSALGVALVALYIGFHLLGKLPFGDWGVALSLGQAMFVLLLAPAFFEPLRDLSAAWHDRAGGLAAVANIENLRQIGLPLLDQAAAPSAIPWTSRQRQSRHGLGVQLRNLSFAHAGEAPLFEAFNLTIQPGERLALTGDSGAGKSILLALMAGLLVPQHGEVRIDGELMKADNAARLRCGMTWMEQQPHLFTGSADTNIRLGRTPADPQALQRMLELTGLLNVIEQLPAPILGEGGIGLSGGEALRLALARLAVHSNAGLLLIDEPTAHLDTQTAEMVTHALLQLAQHATLVVASHDPVLIERMSRVVSLQGIREEL